MRKLLKMNSVFVYFCFVFLNSVLNNRFNVSSLNKGYWVTQNEGDILLGEMLLMLNRFCLPVKTQKHWLEINKTLLTLAVLTVCKWTARSKLLYNKPLKTLSTLEIQEVVYICLTSGGTSFLGDTGTHFVFKSFFIWWKTSPLYISRVTWNTILIFLKHIWILTLLLSSFPSYFRSRCHT